MASTFQRKGQRETVIKKHNHLKMAQNNLASVLVKSPLSSSECKKIPCIFRY